MSGELLGYFLVGWVFFHHEVVDDESLSLHGVLAHIIFKEFGHVVALMQCDGVETHARTDECLEFFGVDFAKPFESGNLWVGTELFNGGKAFFV